MSRIHRIALAASIGLMSTPGLAAAFSDCPASSVGYYTCTELKGGSAAGGYFRVTFPSTWDGDLVIANHGFDLNDLHIAPHEVCGNDNTIACQADTDCGSGNFCNNISYMGLDEILLPKGKAIAAGTYSSSGWAPFNSAKDLKNIINFVKKDKIYGPQLKRIIVTGFSGGGGVTGDATVKLAIDGAVPMCAAVGGGLPTWDVATDVRLVYDFLCDGVSGARFLPPSSPGPDFGMKNTADSGADANNVGLKADECFGIVGVFPHTPEMDTRLAEFIALTNFTGVQGPKGALNVAFAMGFATVGMGDFVFDKKRLNGKRIGRNDTLDYSVMGTDSGLAASFNAAPPAGAKRMTKGPGRSKLAKAFYPDFTKGIGAKVNYPILSMAGANDWLVIPEFQRVYDTALTAGGKSVTQVWTNTFGHCVFSREETTAVFNKYFEWIGNHKGDPAGAQPTPADVHAECLSPLVGGVEGDTCTFLDGYSPGYLYNRIPARPDWPAAAKP